MCKLPKGISDFKKLMTQGYVYIDKTKYIEHMEQSNDSYIHLLRPRRFGKTLFTSMLQYYYDVNEKDQFATLFKDTYIGKHPTQLHNSYYILKFNFSGFSQMQGKDLEEEFKEKVKKAIELCIQRYGFNIELTKHMSAARLLSGFLSDVQTQLHGHKLYVIVDEYDHFANDLLSFRFNEFTKITGADGYVRALFEEIKAGTETVIDRVFVTGVSPITLDSMTSGYNISTNLSLDANYNEIMGFTTVEMKELISFVDHIKDQENILKEMKQYYDGYKFSKDGIHHLFNPNMALYFLDSWQIHGKGPSDIVDKNIISDYKKLENLLELPYEQSQRGTIQEILDGVHPNVVITELFTIESKLSTDHFYSLLFYLGYLTIDESNDFGLTMKIPNMVMQKVFISYYRQMLEKTIEFKSDTAAWHNAIVSFLTKNDSSLFVICIENILHTYPDRLFVQFHERNIQQIAQVIVEAITGVDADMEWVNDEGYGDFMMIPASDRYPNKLIEFKYLKVGYSQKELEHTKVQAKKQIIKYNSTRQMSRKYCDNYIMIFSKDQCVYCEQIS